jgi:phosphosulfolactate synthase (CoM biosynthesis protein A)
VGHTTTQWERDLEDVLDTMGNYVDSLKFDGGLRTDAASSGWGNH